MLADDLRSARERSGLSLRGLADRAGTSAATVHAYEHGRKEPGWSTFERILAAAGCDAVVEVLPSLRPPDYPVSSLVRDLAGSPEQDRLRLAMEFVDRWHETPHDRRRLVIAEDPGLVGVAHWDALVGGLVEHLAWHDVRDVPSWTSDPERFLDGPWWPEDLPTVRARSLAEVPAAFVRRGVMLLRSDLERA